MVKYNEEKRIIQNEKGEDITEKTIKEVVKYIIDNTPSDIICESESVQLRGHERKLRTIHYE